MPQILARHNRKCFYADVTTQGKCSWLAVAFLRVLIQGSMSLLPEASLFPWASSPSASTRQSNGTVRKVLWARLRTGTNQLCLHSIGKDLVTSKHLFLWNLTPELDRSFLSYTCIMTLSKLLKDLWSLISHPQLPCFTCMRTRSWCLTSRLWNKQGTQPPGPFPKDGESTHRVLKDWRILR